MNAWRKHPEPFTGRPNQPKYKHKTAGRNLLIYEWGAIWKREFNWGLIAVSGLGVLGQTKQTRKTVDQVRLAPNKLGFTPRLVNGRPLKATNQLYNKQRTQLHQQLAKSNRFTSRQRDRLTTKRTRHVLESLHTASRRVIELLVAEGIGMLIIGKNPLWKQGVELGRKHNQEFVQIPHPHFSGRRDGRWYRADGTCLIHSDVNGAYNIGRKGVPTAFGQGIGAAAVRPRRLAV